MNFFIYKNLGETIENQGWKKYDNQQSSKLSKSNCSLLNAKGLTFLYIFHMNRH